MGKLRRWAGYIVAGVNYIVTGVIGAAIGAALATFLFNFVEDRHEAVVKVVNDRISKLYQPFAAASVENDMAWCVFVEGTWRATTTDRPQCNDPTKDYWDQTTMPDADVSRWRSQIKSNFQLLNEDMLKIIEHNSGLLINDEEPPLWKVFMKHTLAYKGLTANWKPDDQLKNHVELQNIHSNVAYPSYPKNLTLCSRKLVDLLRAELSQIEDNPFIWSESKIVMPDKCKTSSESLSPQANPRS